MILTRKLKLELIDRDNLEYLYNLNYLTFKAYNTAVNALYFSSLFKDIIFDSDKEIVEKRKEIIQQLKSIDEEIFQAKDEDKENKDELKRQKTYLQSMYKSLFRDVQKTAEEFYGGSERNLAYKIINKDYSELPSYIKAAIGADVYANYKSDIGQIRRGEISLRTYRKGIPIPFMKSAGKFIKEDDNIFFQWVKGIKFKIIFGRDKSARQVEVERILACKLKISDSKIQFKNKKIFLLLAINQSIDKKELDKNIAVGVDLGIKYPAYVSTNSGIQHKHIGSYDDLFKLRLQIQERKKRLQKNLKYASGGKGRKKKLKALNRIETKERNYIRTYNHSISKEIVNFTLQNKAANIIIEDLSGFGSRDDNKKRVLRNWSYFELQSMIKYKAELKGIKVIEISPKYTSQTCAICGERGDRDTQNSFVCSNPECENFNQSVNADYNASFYIAKTGLEKK